MLFEPHALAPGPGQRHPRVEPGVYQNEIIQRFSGRNPISEGKNK